MKWDKEAHEAEYQKKRKIQAEANRKQNELNAERGLASEIKELMNNKHVKGVVPEADILRLRLQYIARNKNDHPMTSMGEYILQEWEKENA